MSKIFAHRGVTYAAPDNSAQAFAAAVALGIDGVELDVRATKDGALICHHDAQIESFAPFAELNLADLPPSVCRFYDAMEILDGLIVNVEIKNDPKEPGYDSSGKLEHAVVEAIIGGGWAVKSLISSFNPQVLELVRGLDPSLSTALLVDLSQPFEAALELAVALGCVAFHPFVLDLKPERVDAVHARGLALNTWTVNGPLDIANMGTWGVDGVITDSPAEAREILAKLSFEVPGS
ncbi:MAG: glycerophosphodiester phosphodiesterase [Actinomycetes bacterium]